MRFQDVLTAVSQGKKVTRPAWDNTAVYYSGEELDTLGLTREDVCAEDWVVEPERNFSLSESKLVEIWNASLPTGAADVNRAPNSPRFQRFIALVRETRG